MSAAADWHALLKPDPTSCPNNHDPWTLTLSLCLCFGLILSYLPQHLRIILSGTSEGISPWFLLLGATSSVSGMLNLLIMQWPLFQCCRVVGIAQCAESLLRFDQVFLQWLLFSLILVLYIAYFPRKPALARENTTEEVYLAKVQDLRVERRKGYAVAWVCLAHFAVLTIVTVILLLYSPVHPRTRALRRLATFCGLSATLLAVLQYAPQIYKTYRSGLVGALSIGTMLIQVPGSILFVVSIMLGDGTDWTSWIPYAVTGAMQAVLLGICVAWTIRQNKLGIDAFGNPLPGREVESDERTPLIYGNGNGNGNEFSNGDTA